MSMIGKTLAHYEITSQLGKGGMGVVYLAHDTHLDRSVAIKVLPAEKVADPDRKRRFVQEAKAASALNHPNIITIYDIDQVDSTDFIVMEYISGRTLDELIPRKGMRLSPALKYAVQIADALAKAHSAGIIHRDLKPSNIMVNEDGIIKILDFGLAKLTEQIQGDEFASTASVDIGAKPVTEKGVIIGTVAYMSPEQAEGKQVDPRSDIFSFGSVLYEMITGQRAFQGDTKISTISAILNKEPASLSADISRDIEKTIARCLRKDPARRFQTMADLKVALQELKEDSDSGKLEISSGTPKRKRMWLPLAIAVLLVCLAASFLFLWQHGNKPATLPLVLPLTDYAGREQYPSLSPDGKQVAFSWAGEKGENEDIYIKLVNSETALRLTTDPAVDTGPAWKPDGSQIAFIRSYEDHAAIFLTSPLGGADRKLADMHDFSGSTISWSPDGEWLAVVDADSASDKGVFLFPSLGGEKRKLISSSAVNLRFNDPAFSPDGLSLAYAGCKGVRSCDIYVQDLERHYLPKGSARQVTREGTLVKGIAWAQDGRSILYAASPDLGNTYRLRRVAVSGDEKSELLSWAGEQVLHPTVSRSGNKLAYSREISDWNLWKFQAGIPPVKFTSSTRREFDPQFSPDRERLAFSANRAGMGSELWVARADGTNPVRLTEGIDRMLGGARWSPDSRWIIYNAQQEDGLWDIFRIDAAGGKPQNLTANPADENLPSYSRDGKWIYFSSNRTGRHEIYRMPAAGGEARQITDNGGLEAQDSWDGKTLYYTKNGKVGLYARPTVGGPETPVLESVHLTVSSFIVAKDGIYYVFKTGARGTGPLEFRFLELPSSKSRLLMQFNAEYGQGLTISPDEKTMLYSVIVSVFEDLILVDNFR